MMEKPAPTQLNIHPHLKRRWSPRSFTSKPVSKEALQRIFEAARWTPSSSNDQPWRFILGLKEDETWSKIMDTLVDFNKKWANLAPVLVMSIGKKTSDKTGKPSQTFQYDVGQSVANITLQAMEEGLFAHQMGGFDKDKALKLFSIPEDYQPLTVIAIGYKGEPELLVEDFPEMEKSERKRKTQDDFLFSHEFGKPSEILL